MGKATFLILLGLGVVSFYEADAICSLSCSWIGKTFIRIEDNANFKFSCEDTSTYTMSLGYGKSSTEQCVWLSGAFLVIRRNQHEYRCWKITHDDNVHVSTFVTPWRFFKQPPATICDVCGGFQKKAIIHFVQGSKPNNLKLIAKNCEFEHLKDRLIRDRIVCGTNSSGSKERLLREDGLTLDKAVGICRADEESRKQMKTLNEEEQVHALRRKTQNQRTNRNEGYAKKGPSRRDREARSNSSFSCGKCGTTHERRNCPHTRKKSAIMQKPNHYQKFCKSKFSKSVHGLDEYSSCESDGENYFVGAVNRKTEIKENACFFIIQITSYSGDKLKSCRKMFVAFKRQNCEFFVTETNQSPLLGFKASNELGLIHVIMTVQTDVDDPVKSFRKSLQA
ncbi:unnamed protein product [Mytilus coruscus]|uniref:CCHC-type domain-containing protein n=1 Tax=Mytilus coruscus TaxID=42192 RepID=A0A6J8AI91_MYTCO|nr:unnamed protein product [Mytilus coruscus]